MLIVTGLVELRPETIEDFKRISVEMFKASRAEVGCHGYAYYQDIENPSIFRVYEQWTDNAALMAHFQEPHTQSFMAAIREIGVIKMDVNKYERGEVMDLM